jgi:hypothetical protein
MNDGSFRRTASGFEVPGRFRTGRAAGRNRIPEARPRFVSADPVGAPVETIGAFVFHAFPFNASRVSQRT